MSTRHFPTDTTIPGIRRSLRFNLLAEKTLGRSSFAIAIRGIGALVVLVMGAVLQPVLSSAQYLKLPNIAPCASASEVKIQLSKLNVAVQEGRQSTLSCPAGTVVRMDPPSGTRVTKGMSVTLYLARRVPIGAVTGLPGGTKTPDQQPTKPPDQQPTKPPPSQQPTKPPPSQQPTKPPPSQQPTKLPNPVTPDPVPTKPVQPSPTDPDLTPTPNPSPSATSPTPTPNTPTPTITPTPPDNTDANIGNGLSGPVKSPTPVPPDDFPWGWVLAAILFPVTGFSVARLARYQIWKRRIETKVSVDEPVPSRLPQLSWAAPPIEMKVRVSLGDVRFQTPIIIRRGDSDD